MVEDTNNPSGVNTWSAADASTFKVRGPNYLNDRVKYESMPAMFETVKCDMFSVDEKVPFVANHPSAWRMRMRARGDNRFLIILNFMIPPVQCIMYYALEEGPLCWKNDPDRPETTLWNRWLKLSQQEKEYRIKLMSRVAEGPWLARKAIASKPIVLGGKFPMDIVHKENDYIEISCDCLQSSRSAKNIVAVLIGAGKSLVIDCCMVLEGREENELPERIIGGTRVQFPNTTSPPRLLPLVKNEGEEEEEE